TILEDDGLTVLERTAAYAGGLFSSLWTDETSDQTLCTIVPTEAIGLYLGRPFWRYVGNSSSPIGRWITRGRGWRPPYGRNYDKAQDALQIPARPTGVERITPNWWEPVRGPRPAVKHSEWGKGGGPEYYRGWRFPE